MSLILFNIQFQVNPLLFCFSDKSPLINCASFVPLVVCCWWCFVLFSFCVTNVTDSFYMAVGTFVKQQPILTIQPIMTSPPWPLCHIQGDYRLPNSSLWSKLKMQSFKGLYQVETLPVRTISEVTKSLAVSPK